MGSSEQLNTRVPSRQGLDSRRPTGSAAKEGSAPVHSDDVGVRVTPEPADLPVELSWISEYQPCGGNLWCLQNWGIASVLRYLRDEVVVEPVEKRRNHERVMGTRPAEATAEAANDAQSDARTRGRQVDVPAGHSNPPGREAATDFPEAVLRIAWRRQGGRCASCGRWLIWEHRGRDGGTGAWEAHRRIPREEGGVTTTANCILFCCGIANCHFKIGHGGVEWSRYAALEDPDLPFLFERRTVPAGVAGPVRPERSLLRRALGIAQPKKGKKPPGRWDDDSLLSE